MMSKEITLTLVELCQTVDISQDELVEIVDLGVIAPVQLEQVRWKFDYPALSRLRRARRLRAELDLDWPGLPWRLRCLKGLVNCKNCRKRTRDCIANLCVFCRCLKQDSHAMLTEQLSAGSVLFLWTVWRDGYLSNGGMPYYLTEGCPI